MQGRLYEIVINMIPLSMRKQIRGTIECLKGHDNSKCVDKKSVNKAMYLLSELGVNEICLINTRKKDAEWWNAFNTDRNPQIPIVNSCCRCVAGRKANRWVTSFERLTLFCQGILDIDFNELYILMVKSIVRSYSKICIINIGRLAKRLQADFKKMEIEYDVIEPEHLVINHEKKTIVLEKEYDLVWCPIMDLFDYKAYSDVGQMYFFKPAACWYMNHFARFLGYDFEYDIALNVIPKVKKLGVDVLVFEDISKYQRQSKYNTDPIAYVNSTGDQGSYNECFKTYPFEVLKATQGGWCIHGNFLGMQDNSDDYRVCIAGERKTCNSKYDDKPNVYFIGPCTFWGGYVSDDYTIESIIQNSRYMYYNCHNMTADWIWSPLRMRTLPLKEGDAIVLVAYNEMVWKKRGISLISIEEAFNISDEEYRDCVWDNPYHCNENMNKRYAQVIANKLDKKYNVKESSNTEIGALLSDDQEKNEIVLLYNYKKDVSGFALQNMHDLKLWYDNYITEVKAGINGAIVMNCNPFTLGHKYLIEYAAQRVEHLYVFVVEEDKSYYSFDDRFMMVEQNCKKMRNVSVISSGKFMISVSTLAGYFDKDSLQERNIFDALYDLELFGSVISKLFNIKYRFVGEEPTDAYTNNYNKQMKTLLPNYGIEILEVPRLEVEGLVVSGSYCRKLFQLREWDELSKYITPETKCVLERIANESNTFSRGIGNENI